VGGREVIKDPSFPELQCVIESVVSKPPFEISRQVQSFCIMDAPDVSSVLSLQSYTSLDSFMTHVTEMAHPIVAIGFVMPLLFACSKRAIALDLLVGAFNISLFPQSVKRAEYVFSACFGRITMSIERQAVIVVSAWHGLFNAGWSFIDCLNLILKWILQGDRLVASSSPNFFE
jgi:hypothetical protein